MLYTTPEMTRMREMTQDAGERAGEIVDLAVDSARQAMQSGIRFQQDIARWWSQAIGRDGLMRRWRDTARGAVESALPPLRDGTEQYLRLVDQNSQAARELLRRTLDASEYRFVADAQLKTQDLFLSSIEIMRSSAATATQGMVQLMESWGEVLRQNVHDTGEVARESIRRTTRAPRAPRAPRPPRAPRAPRTRTRAARAEAPVAATA